MAVVFGIDWKGEWVGTKGRLWKRMGKWRRVVMSDAKNGNGAGGGGDGALLGDGLGGGRALRCASRPIWASSSFEDTFSCPAAMAGVHYRASP